MILRLELIDRKTFSQTKLLRTDEGIEMRMLAALREEIVRDGKEKEQAYRR
jgi:hypothetical protein